jgi:hypothetical protein
MHILLWSVSASPKVLFISFPLTYGTIEQQMMGQVNRERLAEFLGEIQRKEDTNDRYVAALKGETLTRKRYERIQPVPVHQQPAQENAKDQQATQEKGKAK